MQQYHNFHNSHNHNNVREYSIDNNEREQPQHQHHQQQHTMNDVTPNHNQNALPNINNNNNTFAHKANQTMNGGLVQRNRPAATCIHKATIKCSVEVDRNRCCACLDERPHEPFYTKYVDGVGTVSNATRWDYYCPACKVFWENAIRRSGVAPQDSKIPHYPTQVRRAPVLTPQNSGLSTMLASANVSPVAPQPAPTQQQQQQQPPAIGGNSQEAVDYNPLSTSSVKSAGGKPTLSKLTIPQSNRPMPVLTVHFKSGQQDTSSTQQKKLVETAAPRFTNPFRMMQRPQQLHPRAIAQPHLQRSNAILRSAGGSDYPSPPVSSTLSREHSDYYSNEDPESDNDSICSSSTSVSSYGVEGEDLAKETESFQTQRNHTRLATRALVRGDFLAAESHFTTAYVIACSSRWKASSRSDRVALAIKIAEAQSSQGKYDKAMKTLELASDVAEEMSTNEYYYKVQLAMSEVGFKVAEAAEKRRKRVMKSVEEEYGRDSELFREGNRIAQFAGLMTLAGKVRDDESGEPARKRINIGGGGGGTLKKGKSDLTGLVSVKKEVVDVDEEEQGNWQRGNRGMAIVEAMA